eukprot:5304667-Pyramimonas_sp.AAC.1
MLEGGGGGGGGGSVCLWRVFVLFFFELGGKEQTCRSANFGAPRVGPAPWGAQDPTLSSSS